MSPAMRFAGSDYDHARDSQRLERQHERVLRVMQDGQQHTLAGISEITGDPPASISAQLRHLRRPEFGAHQIEKTYLGAGLYAYRLVRQEPQKNESPLVEQRAS